MSSLLHLDNGPAYNALSIPQFDEKNITILEQDSCLHPVTFFPPSSRGSSRTRLQGLEAIKRGVTKELRGIQKIPSSTPQKHDREGWKSELGWDFEEEAM